MKKLIIILMMFLANNVLADSYNCTTTGMYTNCNGGGNSGGSDLLDLYKQLGANYTGTLKATQEAQLRAIEIENAKYELEMRKLRDSIYNNK